MPWVADCFELERHGRMTVVSKRWRRDRMTVGSN